MRRCRIRGRSPPTAGHTAPDPPVLFGRPELGGAVCNCADLGDLRGHPGLSKDGRSCRCGFGGLVIHVVAGHRLAYPGVCSAVPDGIKLPGAGDALELMPAHSVEDKPGTGTRSFTVLVTRIWPPAA
jgi:hypothetical protein